MQNYVPGKTVEVLACVLNHQSTNKYRLNTFDKNKSNATSQQSLFSNINSLDLQKNESDKLEHIAGHKRKFSGCSQIETFMPDQELLVTGEKIIQLFQNICLPKYVTMTTIAVMVTMKGIF